MNHPFNETRGFDNKTYRAWFQKNRIPHYYYPYVHVGFNLGVLLLLVGGHFSQISDWDFRTLGVLGVIFLLGNIVVWAFHRYPLHRRYKLWSFPYGAHTVSHHRYFTADHITYDKARDLYAIFFPASVVAAFALVAQPGFYYAARFFSGSDLAHAFAGGAASYFLAYEFFHWASHLPAEHFLIKYNGWLRYMRKHHLVHHNPRLMGKYNFCIVYPLMDIIMGTQYKGVLPEDNHEDHYQEVLSQFK